MANKSDYVALGIRCADVCKFLDRGMRGTKLEDLSLDVFAAIEDFTK